MSKPFPDPRVLLHRHGLRAKKSWGQNFLVAERVYRAITDATVRRDDDWIVEIGAGLGTLTTRLAERVPEGKVIAIERDRDMVSVLHKELGHLDNVEIVEANALTYDLGTVARWRGEPITICGNLPYNVASQILFRVLLSRQCITQAVVMLQREMAERLLARPGTKSYGALGVLMTTYTDISLVMHVPRTAFTPAPKVESAVVRLQTLKDGASRAPVDDYDHYATVVHTAFQQRRKTLQNALRARFQNEDIQQALSNEGIDGKRRGETLGIDEFARLAAALPKKV